MDNEDGNSSTQVGQLVTKLYSTYSHALIHILGFDEIECLIFFYLFCMKVYKMDPTHSRYKIYKAINKILASSHFPSKPQHVSEKKVYESLDRLTDMGYVKKREIKNPSELKKSKKQRAGRPPTRLYEAKSISTIMEKVRNDFREKEAKIMEILNFLNEIEEAVGTK